jgi:hypothetical protein
MTRRARWIGIGACDAASLHARCVGLAEAQAADAEPIVVWGAARSNLCFGQGLGVVWVDEGQPLFVLIVPTRLAPGRARRWIAWALAPAIATCRSFGVLAYLEGHDLLAAGRRICGAGCNVIANCAVIAASLPRVHPGERLVEARFRAAIEAQFGWQFETSWPSAAERQAMAEVAAWVG